MAAYELDIKIYTDFAAAEADADADCEYDLWLAAATAYWAAHDSAKSKWEAIPAGEAKDSAHNKADNMQLEGLFSHDNQLAWYVAAVVTYEVNN
jgi:hypothetical protein